MSDKSTQEEMEGFGPNPRRYARLSVPFRTKKHGSDAFQRFVDAISKAREECGIPEVVVGLMYSYEGEHGEPLQQVAAFDFGDPTRAEALAAFTYGKMAEQRKDLIARSLRLASTGKGE